MSRPGRCVANDTGDRWHSLRMAPVSQQPERGPNTVRVTCPTCHERLDVGLKDKPQAVPCTYCAAAISVPSRSQALENAKPGSTVAPTVEEYAIAAPAVDTKRAGSKTRAASDAAIVVVCPVCHERMRVVPSTAPRPMACTDCGSMVAVPARGELQRGKAAAIAPAPSEEIGEYATRAPHARPVLRTQLFDRLAEIRTEAPVPPPRWTFYSGVFTFPWRKAVIGRWGGMTVGFTALFLLLSIFAVGPADGGAGLGVVALGFFALPLIWVLIFTLSYSAACCLRILESTAAGLDDVEGWPDPIWKEWAGQLIYLLWIAAMPTVVCFGIGRLAQLAGLSLWPVMLGLLFVIFPIVLLSALEANSVWVPLTRPILVSLWQLWWGWGLFYLESGCLAGLLWAQIYFGRSGFEIATLISFAPMLSACMVIYARLLGRLAWKIGQVVSR
jgi:ribosomal protein S27E